MWLCIVIYLFVLTSLLNHQIIINSKHVTRNSWLWKFNKQYISYVQKIKSSHAVLQIIVQCSQPPCGIINGLPNDIEVYPGWADSNLSLEKVCFNVVATRWKATPWAAQTKNLAACYTPAAKRMSFSLSLEYASRSKRLHELDFKCAGLSITWYWCTKWQYLNQDIYGKTSNGEERNR